ncbi:MAG: tetratricopeptide repeat protein [Deltaproteobacteria bacterium]|nr:tetratricopeptide repeat protein [Deltaproteobacteria bacterium]MBW1818728.1 tetratricopeptide repeat protein [Deltaproteobacteria bacterium]
MLAWKITGIIATAAIILSMPLYALRVDRHGASPPGVKPAPRFVGSGKCQSCHNREYDLWKGSHHERAMAPASDETVLGDFNDAVFTHFGTESRFYKKDGRFFVRTSGPGGRMGEHEITHTFGWYPLQQYLVPFPGGRFQCLPIAWDVEKGKWYHLYPDDPIDPGDWLYWTNAGQNWNGMCAECHSTNLRKNFDLHTNTYDTRWSEISVGCEACHGPGSRHVAWAELPDMARPETDNFDLAVKTSALTSRSHVELCAPCHSRRAALGDYTHTEPDLLDSMLPTLLEEGRYFPDGQILDEVYVYGSFVQSKMYHRDVRCSDCHEVHSAKRIKEGNNLCLQCHRADEYDTKAHHFHKTRAEKGEPIRSDEGDVLYEVGTGADCTQCHMPGRVYMGIDYRPDHSFRIPRPDLDEKLGTPDACSRCHVNQSVQWCNEAVGKWYGPGRRPHYGAILAAGRQRDPEAGDLLVRLAGDSLYPVIVRATALSLLEPYAGETVQNVFTRALMDEEALIRRTALAHLHPSAPGEEAKRIAPLLYDPVKAVRTEAAHRLAGPPSEYLTPHQQHVYTAALREFETTMAYSADFAFGRFNLANLNVSLGREEEAVKNYLAAIAIDDLFYPAKVNLAMLYNGQGEKARAEALLREVAASHPDLYDAAYSLGLLLAEREKYEEAVHYLERAAKGMPRHARAHYNLGLLRQYLGNDAGAEISLRQALEVEPASMDFLYALADFYLKRGRLEQAEAVGKMMIEKHPQNKLGYEILKYARGKRRP